MECEFSQKMHDRIDICAVPHPFTLERIDGSVFPGMTVAEIVSQFQPDEALRRNAHVYIDDSYINQELWRSVRPKAGTRVTIRMVPTGSGGGKNPLRTVLSLAVLAASPALGVQLGSVIFSSFGAAVTPSAFSVGTSLVNFAGRMLINALAPISQSRGFRNPTERDSPTLFIQGARNQVLPFGRIPRPLGRHRMVPPMGARVYTETEGNLQYVRMLFVWGYGPLEISDLRIGETSIEEFEGVEIETRQGFDDDAPLSLYSQTVRQNDLSVLVSNAAGYQTRTTDDETDEISVDITLPRGLVEFDSQGKKKSRNVQVEVQYAPSGTSDWSAGATAFKAISAQQAIVERPTAVTTQGVTTHRVRVDRIVLDPASGVVRVIAGSPVFVSQDPVLPAVPESCLEIARITRRSDDDAVLVSGDIEDERLSSYFGPRFENSGDFAVTVDAADDTVNIAAGGLKNPGIVVNGKKTSALRRSIRFSVLRGQYDVRVRRLTADTSSDKIFDQCFWTALRSITHESPVNMAGLAVTALRIKATDQLNGVVDQFNGVVHSILPDWDGSQWVEQPASNPAAIFRHVLQGSANARPLPDSRLDLGALEAWHEVCSDENREFNMVVDFDASVRETLSRVAAAGRASPTILDGKWSVIRDQAQLVPVQHFTPRNSFGFKGEKSFDDVPHALRVRFINREKSWQQDERLVFDDGYDEVTATKYEGVDFPGITDPEQVWRDARYHLAAARLRPETYSFSADIEHIVCTRGDLIRFTHDVPLFGLMSARVKSVTGDGGGPEQALSVMLDAEVEMEAGKSYSLRFRKSDGSSLVKTVTTIAGTTADLQFATPFDMADGPQSGDLCMFGETGRESVELIVKAIEPQGDMTARLLCVDAAPAIHLADSEAIPEFDSYISLPPELQRPDRPIVLSVQSGEEVLIRNADGSFTSRIVITLQPPEAGKALTTRVMLKGRDESDFAPAQITALENFQVSVIGVEAGEIYDIALRYQTDSGMLSQETVISSHYVTGATGIPSDVENFAIHILGGTAHLSWNPVADIDLSHYKIKFAPKLSGASWGSSVDLVQRVSKPATSISVPAAIGTYLVKAVDASGRESENAALIVSTISGLAGLNVIDTVSEAPGFSGVKTNTGIANDKLRLTGADSIDDWENIDLVGNADVGDAGLAASGIYEFTNYFDLGSVYTSVLSAEIDVAGLDINDSVDERDSVDGTENWDGGVDPSKWDAILQMRTTQDDPSGSPGYSEWKPFTVGEYTARAFEWRLLLTSRESGITPAVSGLNVVIDMPDRVEAQEDLLSSAAGSAVTFVDAFRAAPAIAISAQNMATGDYYEITGKTESGFNIRFFNSGGTGVARSFDYVAKGYGLAV